MKRRLAAGLSPPAVAEACSLVGRGLLPLVLALPGVACDRSEGGWEARLPSEAKWVKAARGGLVIASKAVIGAGGRPRQGVNPDPRRRFPWGNRPCLTRRNYARSTIFTSRPAAIPILGGSP
jgi:hypothetical protein